MLERVSIDVAFLGVDAIDPVAGAMAQHEGEASINQLMSSQAGQVVVVADSSKIGRRAFARICAPGEIDVLVTDAGLADDAAGAVRRGRGTGDDGVSATAGLDLLVVGDCNPDVLVAR